MFARYLQGQIGKHSSLTAIFACQQVMQGSPQLQFALFHCPLHFAPFNILRHFYYSFTHLVSQISSIFCCFITFYWAGTEVQITVTSQQVPGVNLPAVGSRYMWSLHVLPVAAWVLSGYLQFKYYLLG